MAHTADHETHACHGEHDHDVGMFRTTSQVTLHCLIGCSIGGFLGLFIGPSSA